MTIAQLGIAVDSGQAKSGAVDLNMLEAAAKRAEAATQGLASGAKTAGSALGQMGQAAVAEASAHDRATLSTRMNTAAIQANNTAMRMAGAQRTNLIFQLNDIGVSLASGMNPLLVAVQQGSQIATIYEGGVVPALKETAKWFGAMAIAYAPVVAGIGLVAAAVGGLTYEINKTADVQVNFFDVALAGWQLFAEGVASLVAPVFGALGSWLQQGWDMAAPILKGIGNAIVGTFVGSFEAIQVVWANLPSALGDWAYQAAQVVADAFTTMGQNVIISINQTINAINDKFGSSMPTLGVPYEVLPGAQVGNPFKGAGAGLTSGVSNAFGSAMGRDYMGDAFGALSGRAQELAAARKEVDDIGSAANAANDNVKKLATDGFGQVKSWAEQFGEAAKGAFSNLGSGIVEAFKKGGNIAENILSMLMDRVGQLGETLLNNGLNALFGGLFGGFSGMGMGSGLGGISSITGSSGGFFPGFAGGGYTGSGPRSGGLDGQGGFMAMLHPQETVFDHAKGMQPANQNKAAQPVSINIKVEGARGNSEIQQMVAAGVSQGLKGYDKQLPGRLRDINQRYG